jgi:hypothetical protein
MVRLCFQRRLRINLTDDKQYINTWWRHDKLLQIKIVLHNPQFNEIQYNNLQPYAKRSPGEKRGVMPNLVCKGRPPLVNPLKKRSYTKVKENKIIISFQNLLIRNWNTYLSFVLPHKKSIIKNGTFPEISIDPI